MHVVLGLIQSLCDSWDDLADTKRKELIKLVLEQSVRLSDFVVDILDMSKLLDDAIVFDKTSCRILKVVNEAISEFQENNKEQKFVLSNEAQLDDKCYIDVIRIKQVIKQLLLNSMCFGVGGNVISIHISNEVYNLNHHKNKWIKVSVSDCGTGIPIQEQESVFGVFEESSRTRNNAGAEVLFWLYVKKILLNIRVKFGLSRINHKEQWCLL